MKESDHELRHNLQTMADPSLMDIEKLEEGAPAVEFVSEAVARYDVSKGSGSWSASEICLCEFPPGLVLSPPP